MVRAGANHWHAPVTVNSGGKEFRVHAHTMGHVLSEMVLQICMDYSSLPDYRTLETEDIVRFYEGIRGSQIRATRPRSSK